MNETNIKKLKKPPKANRMRNKEDLGETIQKDLKQNEQYKMIRTGNIKYTNNKNYVVSILNVTCIEKIKLKSAVLDGEY